VQNFATMETSQNRRAAKITAPETDHPWAIRATGWSPARCHRGVVRERQKHENLLKQWWEMAGWSKRQKPGVLTKPLLYGKG
jgi:hypothetical protein